MSDKEAVEEDKSVVFEFELNKKFSSSDQFKCTFNGRRIEVKFSKKYALQAADNNVCQFIYVKNIRLEDEGTNGDEINGTRTSARLIVKCKNLFDL